MTKSYDEPNETIGRPAGYRRWKAGSDNQISSMLFDTLDVMSWTGADMKRIGTTMAGDVTFISSVSLFSLDFAVRTSEAVNAADQSYTIRSTSGGWMWEGSGNVVVENGQYKWNGFLEVDAYKALVLTSGTGQQNPTGEKQLLNVEDGRIVPVSFLTADTATTWVTQKNISWTQADK